MNTKDWIVSSDIAAGITSTVLNKLSCKGLSNANMWKPFVESLSLSVLGRLTSSWFSGKMFSSGTDEKPYVKTDEGRSALVIFISSLKFRFGQFDRAWNDPATQAIPGWCRVGEISR